MEESIIKIKLIDENGYESEPIGINQLVYNEDIEFEFPLYEESGEVYTDGSLPYKDFLFFKENYQVVIYVEDTEIKETWGMD